MGTLDVARSKCRRTIQHCLFAACVVLSAMCLCSLPGVFEPHVLEVAAGVDGIGSLSSSEDGGTHQPEDLPVGPSGATAARDSSAIVRPRKKGRRGRVRFSRMSWQSTKRTERPIARNRVRKYFVDLIPLFLFVAVCAGYQHFRQRRRGTGVSVAPTSMNEAASLAGQSLEQIAAAYMRGSELETSEGNAEDSVEPAGQPVHREQPPAEPGGTDPRGHLPTYEESHFDDVILGADPSEDVRFWGPPPLYTP